MGMDTAKIICFVGFLDLLAVSMVLPLIATRVKELGASPGLGGLIGSLYGATQLFSSPVVGSWSDVKGRKLVLLFCLLTTAFTYIAMGSVALIGLTITRIICGAFKHSQSLSQAYLANIASPADKGVYYGYFTATSNIGFIVGPTFGGHLVDLPHGFFWVSLVSGSIFAINAGAVISAAYLQKLVTVWQFLPNVRQTPKPSKKPSTCDHGSRLGESSKVSCLRGAREYFGSLELGKCWHILVLRLILAFATLVYRSSYTLVLSERFGLSGKHIGYLTSYQGIVSAAAGFLVGHVGKVDPDENRQVMYGVATLFLALLGLTLSPEITFLVASLTALCVATSFLRVCLTQAMVSRCPKDKVGAVVGFAQSVTSAARMMSPLVGGLALEMGSYGPGTVSSVSAGIGCVLSVYLVSRPLPKEKVS